MKPMMLNGSQIIMECLLEQGVDTVFGYPGGAILNVYDELYKRRDDITHILTSHEQGASHAADGYARATGKVGVCFATSGPGATNLVTGIATAYMDSIPMVIITCNVGTPLLGKDSFQEVDIAGITTPITKHGFIVKDINKLAETIRRAFEIANTGRKGPVIVDVTKDVTAKECQFLPVEPKKIYPLAHMMKETDLVKAQEAIETAKRPFVLLGGGCISANAFDEINEFVHKVNAPVADTLMGKGAFDGTNPYYTGMVGMHGTKATNIGISNCDLLITLGARFSDRVTGNTKTFARNATILHIDVDPAEINKNIKSDVQVIGDIKAVLRVLNKRLKQQDHKEWLAEVKGIIEKYPQTYEKGTLSGPEIIEKIYEMTDENTIITTEVGQHQMWAAQYYKYTKPRTFLSSGGLGTMGYGLGASLGAKMGCPDKLVVNIAGDGCFRMNMNELATAARYQIPVIEVVINNHVLGMVRQWQTLFYGERYSNTILNDTADYVKVAQALGADGRRVTNIEEFEEAFRYAVELNKPFLIDCMIDSDDKVWPMVAPGGDIEACFTQEDLDNKKED